jgi:hypothetical protein
MRQDSSPRAPGFTATAVLTLCVGECRYHRDFHPAARGDAEVAARGQAE